MDNQDKTAFSLDDEEIVEEEVIDRDEEYEDDDYDDYDDEEYADEEYDDEDYGDEEYDDGYSDDYYDDRLNKVLDEIAELKRGMVPAPVQQQQQMPPPIMPPQYIYQPTAPPAGSEVVMYNEISRLRDELARNQSSLEMQKELTRIKEDMARDQKFAEAQYNAEIQRLQGKIDDLLKNGSSPQGESTEDDEPSHVEGSNHSSLNLDKLLSINEAILRTTKDSDARIQNEIAQLKKQFGEIPSLKELNDAVSAVQKALENAEGVKPEALTALSADIAALKTAIEEKGGATPIAIHVPAPAAVAVARDDGAIGAISTEELLRQLYDIKTVLGNSSEAAVERTRLLYELVNEYKKLGIDVRSDSVSYKDKLSAAYAYAQKLAASNEPDAVDLMIASDELIDVLRVQPLTRTVFADVSAFCAENGIVTVTSAMRDSAEKFFNICEKLATVKIDAYGEYLADLVAQINVLENNRKQAENGELVGKLVSAISEETPDESAVRELLAKLTGLNVSDVIDLPHAEIPEGFAATPAENGVSVFAKLDELKAAVLDAAQRAEERQAAAAAVAEQTAQATVSEQPQQPVADAEPPVRIIEKSVSDDAVKQLTAAVEELKAKFGSIAETPDISSAMEEIRGNYLDITGKLVDISDSLQNVESHETTQEKTVAESVATVEPVLTDDEKERVLDDLAYIRGKADEYAEFITKIDELGARIADINTETVDISAPLAEQISGLLNDLTAQFDKLYDDISNVLIESEANIINHIVELGDGKGTADAIASAKADILADTQSIKDSLLTVTDSIYALPLNENLEATKADILADTQSIKDSLLVLSDQLGEMQTGGIADDAVEQLRADVAALLELTSADHELATTERQKILDDIAYLREQAEFAIADEEEEVISDTATAVRDDDKLSGYLDEISARIAQLSALADDTAFTKESVVALTDSVAAANDGLTAVSDGLTAVTDAVTAVNDGVATVSETLRPIADDVVAARDAATAALDALTPIADQLNAILDRLETGAEEPVAYDTEAEPVQDYAEGAVMSDEELIELKDSLNTILDTLPLFPQADDVVAARDNTYSILDALAAMPQADDVIVTRDNVTAVLDAVNALSDSLTNSVASQSNDDMLALRESVESAGEDIRFIRQKLENGESTDEQSEDIANILQDIGLVLDKIEEYETLSGNNKQEIIDAVNGIREEIHINTLDENMSAAGMDDGTRDALVGEIADIRERLGNIEDVTKSFGDVNGSMLDGITAQIDELRQTLEERLLAVDGATEQGDDVSRSSENMQAIFDELTSLKEKLDMRSEYDTVEEILSLREDIKAARIVDQDEVTSELEAIKNELAAISSGNILDEIRALREDVINLPNSEGGLAPTEGEVNLVLNEIVSLRDEMFAFKDEVLNATAAMVGAPESTDDEEPIDGGEDITTILDELTALRADQSALNGNIDELKDIVSRRTSLSVAETDGEESVAPNAGELDVVLDEIINLKNDVDRIVESMGDDKLAVMSEQIDEIRAVIDELRNGMPVVDHEEVRSDAVSVDLTPVMEQLESVNAALDDLRLNRDADAVVDEGAVGSTFAERFDELRDDIDDIKAAVNEISVPTDYSAEIAELRAEIDALRAENEALKQENSDTIGAELAELKDLVRQSLALSAAPATTSDGETSYAALIEEIRDFKDQVAVAQYPASIDEETVQAIRDAVSGVQQGGGDYGAELAEIRDEIAQLRSLTTISAESGGSAALDDVRAELAELKSIVTSQENLFGVAEDVTAIRADVQTLRDEPDLGVMSEILALRDEFQALREQIEDVKRIAGETDKQADESIMSEVQSLRDQLFAISMANVNDPTSGESNYESYNNIILDELAAIRDQISVSDTANDIASVMDELDRLKAAIDKRDETVDAVVERVAKLNNNVANDRIMSELESLRTDISNQRDADMATLNFMSELAHLVERQNQYLSQNQDSGVKISDEIESLKAEIASSDAVAEEVAKLRELMTQSGNASDNETILSELAKLREELSQEKPSRENDIILDAIARLGDEITVLAEREKVRDVESDADLSDSLSALKDQLSQIADIVEPAEKPATSKPSGGAKRGRKPASKSSSSKSGAKSSGSAAKKKSATSGSSSGAKRGRKPAQKSASTPPSITEPVTTIIDIDSRINEQVESLNGDGDMALNINDLVTGDAMDLADKLAKQVANKLIMEQLVEQLGDGGVSEERVDEILRDILPQEFTTIAETEASDKVRRLANRLVLDKLRARLNGRNSDD